MSVESRIQRDKNTTASSLFGVAALQLFVGALGWFLYSSNFSPLDWIITFSGIIYLMLGILAHWKARSAALTAAVIYAGFLGFQTSRSTELLMAGLLFKIPIVVLLIVAVVSALRRSNEASSK